MKRVFSFAEKPVLFILRLLPTLISGVVKVIAVHFSPDSQSIISDLLKRESGEFVLESYKVSDYSSLFNRLRSENAPYTWLRKEDLPFEILSKEKVQLEIFNELNNSILLIRIKNQFDQKNDLFFIYFNQGLNNIGSINLNKVLSTDKKTIIGEILRNSMLILLENSKKDKDLFETLNENTRAMIKERNIINNEIEITRDKYQHALIFLGKSYLIDLYKNTGITYSFSESTIKKIRNYNGDISDLKTIILKAVNYAEAMNLGGSSNNILIEDFHLVIDESNDRQQKKLTQQVGDVPVKYLKTYLLLDKLESAAQRVKSKNMLLTGSNIGKEFPTPITPPAISDALKKHKQKIVFLLKNYPDHWEIIRTEFRPMQNIFNVKSYDDQLSA